MKGTQMIEQKRGWRHRVATLVVAGLTCALAACGGAAAPVATGSSATTGSTAATINTAALFSDQGSMYDSNTEPSATDPVTVTLRTAHANVTSANLVYYDTADGAFHYVAMQVTAQDPTGQFDEWQGTIPASGSEKYYRFEIGNGSETVWYNAEGVSMTTPVSGDFFVIPGFQTPNWMKNGVM